MIWPIQEEKQLKQNEFEIAKSQNTYPISSQK
jgi:hypothetical protein